MFVSRVEFCARFTSAPLRLSGAGECGVHVAKDFVCVSRDGYTLSFWADGLLDVTVTSPSDSIQSAVTKHLAFAEELLREWTSDVEMEPIGEPLVMSATLRFPIEGAADETFIDGLRACGWEGNGRTVRFGGFKVCKGETHGSWTCGGVDTSVTDEYMHALWETIVHE